MDQQMRAEPHSDGFDKWMYGCTSFEVAAFGFDGELLGTKTRQVNHLSPRWLAVCEALLRECGEVFRRSMGAQLAHIEIQLMSDNGAGLSTFYVNGALVLSLMLCRGENEEAELAVGRMFVDSLRKSPLVQTATASPSPFEDLLHFKTRPLVALVVWPQDQLSEVDADLVRELSTHFAAAYLCRPMR